MKIQKKRIKWLFRIWLVFVTQGVNFKQYSINTFCLENKITNKKTTSWILITHCDENTKKMIWLISKVVTQKCDYFARNLQKKQPRLSCVWKCHTSRNPGQFGNFGQSQFDFHNQPLADNVFKIS